MLNDNSRDTAIFLFGNLHLGAPFLCCNSLSGCQFQLVLVKNPTRTCRHECFSSHREPTKSSFINYLYILIDQLFGVTENVRWLAAATPVLIDNYLLWTNVIDHPMIHHLAAIRATINHYHPLLMMVSYIIHQPLSTTNRRTLLTLFLANFPLVITSNHY